MLHDKNFVSRQLSWSSSCQSHASFMTLFGKQKSSDTLCADTASVLYKLSDAADELLADKCMNMSV